MVKLSNTVPRKLIRLPITELRIDRVTLLVVTYSVNNNALMSLFIAAQKCFHVEIVVDSAKESIEKKTYHANYRAANL